jgi:hypothetical protein
VIHGSATPGEIAGVGTSTFAVALDQTTAPSENVLLVESSNS